MKTTTVRKFLLQQIQRLAAGGVFSLAAFWAGGVQAVPLDFFCITNNSPADCAIGEAQLGVEVTSFGIGTGTGGVDQVLFTFTNTGADMSTISEIYFDDGSLLGLAGLIDADDGIGGDAGVDFTQGANPPDLPGRNNITPAFNVTAGFLADADNPAPRWGVSPGEWLGIVFDLQGAQAFNDVIAELGGGQLRIGMHVTNFDSGGSESFVNNPVPVPAAIWLFGSGLIGLLGVARKKVA